VPNTIAFEHKGRDARAYSKARERIGVLVVDDHPAMCHAVVTLLNLQTGMEVIAEASSYVELTSELHGNNPDVVVLDLQLGDAQGAEALTRLREQHPDIQTIAYSAYDNDLCIAKVVRIGTQGYVLKSSPIEILGEAIRTVARGDYYLDPALTSKLLGRFGSKQHKEISKHTLTEREITVLIHIVAGKRNKEIANSLYISEGTVKYHVSALFAKLRASTRTELAKIAVRDGLVGH